MLHFSRFKTIAVLAITLFGILLAIPNVLPVGAQLPSWFPSRPLVLGLDLQGGSHMLLEVDSAALRREWIEGLRDEGRRVLREERIGYTGLTVSDRGVQLRLRDPADQARALEKLRALATPITSTVLGPTGQSDLEVTASGDGPIAITPTQAGLDQRARSAVDQSIEVLRRRIDELGTLEPNIQRQGPNRILVQVPGLDDPERLRKLIGTTAQLTFRLVDISMPPEQALQGRPPAESELLYTNDDPPQPVLVERRAMVAGEDLTDAQAGFDQQTNEPIVSFRFNASGGRRFGAVTQQNVGRPFAIVLDREVISAPVIREPILGGSGQISGNFTVQSANDLAILLRAGALPAPLTVVEERTVGPGLGRDSIEAGRLAAIVASALVAVFMVCVYGLFGLFALAALAINVTLMFGLQSAIGATLTLPGIAGIVLTVGMALDSNVVIFERIRDEAREGRSAITAIDKGFSQALATIMDANATAFFTAAVLFLFGGSGPVRGFAVTFIIGLITTAFTAFTLTRLIIAWWVRARRPVAIPI